MKWFILFVGIVVICLVAALVLGLVSGGVGGQTSSLRHEALPDTPLTEADLEGLQLDVTARGYRMSQVDGVLDRLRRELREKDEQIAVLRGDVRRAAPEPAAQQAVPEPAAEPAVAEPAAGPAVAEPAARPAVAEPAAGPAVVSVDAGGGRPPADEVADEPAPEAVGGTARSASSEA